MSGEMAQRVRHLPLSLGEHLSMVPDSTQWKRWDCLKLSCDLHTYSKVHKGLHSVLGTYMGTHTHTRK